MLRGFLSKFVGERFAGGIHVDRLRPVLELDLVAILDDSGSPYFHFAVFILIHELCDIWWKLSEVELFLDFEKPSVGGDFKFGEDKDYNKYIN